MHRLVPSRGRLSHMMARNVLILKRRLLTSLRTISREAARVPRGLPDAPDNFPPMPTKDELTVMDWGQLHIFIQWIYRGRVSPEGRGHFAGGSGMAALYILKGQGLMLDGDHERRGGKGDWFFPNMVTSHYQDFSRDAETLSLRFYLEWPDGQPLFRYSHSLHIPGKKYPELLLKAKALERAAYSCSQRNYRGIEFMNAKLNLPSYLAIEFPLLQWTNALYQAFASEGLKPSLERFEDKRVAQALRVLDSWPLDVPFSLDQLQQKVGVSRTQLDQLFTRKLGVTAHQYFDRKRLIHAERMLRLPDRRIKEIAMELGFHHVSNFSAWFKEKTDVSPNVRKANAADLRKRINLSRRGGHFSVR